MNKVSSAIIQSQPSDHGRKKDNQRQFLFSEVDQFCLGRTFAFLFSSPQFLAMDLYAESRFDTCCLPAIPVSIIVGAFSLFYLLRYPAGLAILLLLVPYLFFWRRRMEAQRLREGLPTQNTVRAVPVHDTARAVVVGHEASPST